MSAQVTEAHRELARRIMFEFTQAGTATASDVRMAAQIIADSEAAAKQSLLAAYDAVVVQRNRVTTERDRLRAELDAQCLLNAKGSEREAVLLGRVDRMAKECLNLRADLDAIKAIRDEEKARAASAEREVERLRSETGRVGRNGAEECIRAERAEAELNASRYETVKAAQDGLRECIRAERAEAELAKERARLDWLESEAATELQSERGWIDREAIDAAMKEGA